MSRGRAKISKAKGKEDLENREVGKRGQTPFCRSLLRLIDMKGKQNGA